MNRNATEQKKKLYKALSSSTSGDDLVVHSYGEKASGGKFGIFHIFIIAI